MPESKIDKYRRLTKEWQNLDAKDIAGEERYLGMLDELWYDMSDAELEELQSKC